MAYTIPLPNGTRQINKIATFCGVLGGILPNPEFPINEIISAFDAAIRFEYPAVQLGALNNCHGDWYEWLLSIAAWNAHVRNATPLIALKLPNIRRFDCARLYTENLFEMIQHLRAEVRRSSNVQLISSNPDFVILSVPDISILGIDGLITEITPEIVQTLDQAYLYFVGACDFEAIRAYMSSKVSFRPDRRLQIAHEGSLMKALYVHLQTRLWITNPPGIKYYAMATEVSLPDIQALKTVATHSITTVSSNPQSAVDNVFPVNSLAIAEEAFNQIFNS